MSAASAIDLAQARSLIRNERLWPLVATFLWDFPTLLDPGRRADALAPLADSFPPEADPPRLRAYLMERLGLAPCFHDFPANDGSRLLLLPVQDYLLAATWIGALALEAPLRKVMDGAGVRALKTALPGVYPDLFRYAGYFHAWRDRLAAVAADAPAASADKLAEHIPTLGLRILATILRDLPQPLLDRQRLRFPAALDPAFAPLDGNPFGLDDLPLPLTLFRYRFPRHLAVVAGA